MDNLAEDLRIDKKYPLEPLAPLGCGVQIGAGSIFNVVKPIENETQSLVVFGIGEGTDAAVDCTGAVPVINAMVIALGAGGIAVSVGAPPAAAEISIEVVPFINGCKKYQASNQGKSSSRKFLPFLADLYMNPKLPIDRLQKQCRPSEINDAVRDMLEGTTMKPVIIWS